MGLQRNMRNEPVSRLALREPATVECGATLRDAILRMRERKLGCAVVVDEDRKPVGMFTESMLTQLMARGTFDPDRPIEQEMAAKWPWVHMADAIADVLSAMEFGNIRFLCVVDEEGRLAGVTGQKGLMEYVAEHFPGQVMVQRIGGKPYPQEREGA
jgi:predicted transcriptional regulator